MVNVKQLLEWYSNGLFSPVRTWRQYLEGQQGWQTTLRNLSAPLLVIAGMLALLFTWLFSGQYLFGGRSPFGIFMSTLIGGLVWCFLGGWLASFLASKFGGTEHFDRGFAAVTFASFPALAGNILGTLPWVGGLIALAGGIWSLVLLYQAFPVFLGVPDERRVGHFLSTLGLVIVSYLVIGALLAAVGLGRAASDFRAEGGGGFDGYRDEPSRSLEISSDADGYRAGSRSGTAGGALSGSARGAASGRDGGGLFGFGREMDYIEAANRDRYEPPPHGRVSEDQVKRLVHFLRVADELRNSSQGRLDSLQGKEDASLSDVFRGIKGAIGASTAEMQAVKSGDGNWQEHEWVKRQLFEARLHKDLNDTIAHNYALYQQFETELEGTL